MRARSSTYSGDILRGKTPASGDSGCDPFPMRSGQVRCRPNTPFEDHPPGCPKRIKLSAQTTLFSPQESTLARPPNFKQEKKRREEMQKKRNQEKQRQQAERKANTPPPQKP